MRLTRYTDYAMRVLLYLGSRPGEMSSIGAVAAAYGISRNHLMKVVNELARAGHVESLRGRGGGIRLARPASEIRIGAVVRHMEEDFALADCAGCAIASACGLSCLLAEALAAFLAVLDGQTLADVLERRGGFLHLLEPA